jgi:hypothetical protein
MGLVKIAQILRQGTDAACTCCLCHRVIERTKQEMVCIMINPARRSAFVVIGADARLNLTETLDIPTRLRY